MQGGTEEQVVDLGELVVDRFDEIVLDGRRRQGTGRGVARRRPVSSSRSAFRSNKAIRFCLRSFSPVTVPCKGTSQRARRCHHPVRTGRRMRRRPHAGARKLTSSSRATIPRRRRRGKRSKTVTIELRQHVRLRQHRSTSTASRAAIAVSMAPAGVVICMPWTNGPDRRDHLPGDRHAFGSGRAGRRHPRAASVPAPRPARSRPAPRWP